MATHNSSKVVDTNQPNIQLSLSDRSITWLHSAGMAGLWMTLKQLEKRFPTVSQRPGQLSWNLSSHSIDLIWSGTDQDILDWLLRQSFQINQEGLILLTGLGTTLSIDAQIAIHQGITQTFLQHNKFYTSSGEKRLELKTGEKTVSVRYKGLTSYTHRDFAKSLCDKQGQLLQQPISIAGWLYPGAVMRHAAFDKQTKFEVTPEEALVLLFAPIACWYFMLPTDQDNKQICYVLIVPEASDLAAYAEYDWQIRNSSYENFWAASLGDAGFKFLSLQQTVKSATSCRVRRCQSLLFGKTKWASQQMVRIKAEIVEATEETICFYQLSYESFPKNSVCGHDEKFYIAVSEVRGKIADNLAKGLLWWFDLARGSRTRVLSGEASSKEEALLNMIEKAQWNNQAQKLFINACHEALRRIYAKLYEQASEGEYARIERRNIRIRSEVGRCKNAAAFRRFLSNFFAEAGQVPILQDHWEELLPITTGEIDWQLTRDLLLLALVSYKRSGTSKSTEDSKVKVLETSQTDQEATA